MTMHAIRGPAAEHQLSICMIAMRALSTMYWAAGWIRNIFLKLGEKKQKNIHGMYTSTAPTRAPSPAPAAAGDNPRQSRPADEPSVQRQPAVKYWTASTPSQQPEQPSDTSRLVSQDACAEIPDLAQPVASGMPGMQQYGPPYAGAAVHDPTGLHYLGDPADGRNMVTYMDHPMIDGSGLASIDPDFADWWQDLLAADNPFSNPFITGG